MELGDIAYKKMKGIFPNRLGHLRADFMYRCSLVFSNGDVFWHIIRDLCIMRSEGFTSEVLTRSANTEDDKRQQKHWLKKHKTLFSFRRHCDEDVAVGRMLSLTSAPFL